MKFYQDQPPEKTKSKKAYDEEYQDDLAVIEIITGQVCNTEVENFYFRFMHNDILELTLLETDDHLEDVFPDDDRKDGVRSILFLMLQVCIASQGGNLKEDLNALWKVYSRMLAAEKPLGEDKYCSLVHHVFNLALIFQEHPVSVFSEFMVKCIVATRLICNMYNVVIIQGFSKWTEILKCYPNNKQVSNLMIDAGKVANRWLLSISLIITMNWELMQVDRTTIVKNARHHVKENIKEQCMLTGCGHISELDMIMSSMFPQVPECAPIMVYRESMKSVAIFTQAVIRLRGQIGIHYKPSLGIPIGRQARAPRPPVVAAPVAAGVPDHAAEGKGYTCRGTWSRICSMVMSHMNMYIVVHLVY